MELKVEFLRILGKLNMRKDSHWFRVPVDHEAQGLFDYPIIIKNPMDTYTIKKKLENNEYSKIDDIIYDFRLVWHNAMIYNVPGSQIYNTAKKNQDHFNEMLDGLVQQKKLSGEISGVRPPDPTELANFIRYLKLLTPKQFGNLLSILENSYPPCLMKHYEGKSIEINIDCITTRVIHEVEAFLVTNNINYLEVDQKKRKTLSYIDDYADDNDDEDYVEGGKSKRQAKRK